LGSAAFPQSSALYGSPGAPGLGRASLGDLQRFLFPTALARHKVAFFSLFHSPSGAGCTPKGREAMREIGVGKQLNLSTLEERICGPQFGSDVEKV